MPGAFSQLDAARIREAIDWQQLTITMFGRKVAEPRLSAWLGDSGLSYVYSGVERKPSAWVKPIDEIRDTVMDLCGVRMNSVLCNLYRNGQDSMGWHADNEPELGPQPTIASVSLGGARRFRLRRTDHHAESIGLDLRHGDLLIMRGQSQRQWQHCVPKTRRAVAPRINLTFRSIICDRKGAPICPVS